MTLFAWIVIAGSFIAAGWHLRGLWDVMNAIDESKYEHWED